MPFSEAHMFYWVLLGIFTFISIILACYSLVNVVRLRNVRMSWKAGSMKGYPLFSSIFLGFTIIGLSVGIYNQSVSELIISSLYFVLAGGWFVTSYFTSKRYVTDHGIVKNVNDPSQTVAWYQVRDFVEREKGNSLEFTFIYSLDDQATPENVIRLELVVPVAQKESFKNLISHKLGRRISCYTGEDIKLEQFD